MKNSAYEKVFEGKYVDANFVKNILEDNDIPALLKTDALGQMFPLFVAEGSLKPVKVYVGKENLDRAQDLIDSYLSAR